ncbi:MAG: flagellar FlbD family protein [Clostridia bacterium]|jgi:flagellar protein FlbD|nr:flagellar FlbD family protein [Clostridia bacterium]
MIELTKLNDVLIIINASLIETIEATPDTVITLLNGRKFVVKESVDDVVVKAIAYQKSIMSGLSVSD